ncbi:MAG TPA: hypothetical protein VGJ34_11675 [Gaiellaceae bacterium]|jgi:hypothetical protein
MALLDWDEVSWEDFVAGLEGYRDHFTRKGDGERAYAGLLDGIHGEPLATLPERAADIVRLLNKWACRLSTARTPGALEAWLRDHLAALAEVESLTITNPRVLEHTEELANLHDDLIAEMRANGVNNMADAAASKALHLLGPRLFVMWDREIRRSAPEGYGAYLLQMHGLALRLAEEAPAEDVEAYLQEHLGYETRKTLAKYLDEYNWFEAVGRAQLAARSR